MYAIRSYYGAPLSRSDELPACDRFDSVSLSGYRIGWLGDYGGYLATEPGVLALCEHALANLTAHGAVVEHVAVPFDMARLWDAWLALRHFSALSYNFV